jgi:hypothetical protein
MMNSGYTTLMIYSSIQEPSPQKIKISKSTHLHFQYPLHTQTQLIIQHQGDKPINEGKVNNPYTYTHFRNSTQTHYIKTLNNKPIQSIPNSIKRTPSYTRTSKSQPNSIRSAISKFIPEDLRALSNIHLSGINEVRLCKSRAY